MRARSRRAATVVEWQRVADVRYRGQNWSVPVEWPGEHRRVADARRALRGRSTSGSTARASRRARRSTSGRCAWSRSARSAHAVLARATSSAEAPAARAGADFGPRHGTLEVPVRSRAHRSAEPVAGPLLIDEYDTTVVVPPGWTVALDAATGALVLDHVAVERAAREAARRRRSRVRLVANALETAADEMATTIFRTAHSAVVRDAMDFSAALCGADGRDGRAGGDDPAPARLDPERDDDAARALRRRVRARATSTSSTTRSTGRATRRTSSSSSRPSSTRRCSASPSRSRTTATSAAACPGSCACDSTEVFQEGLRLPWLRLYERGEPVEALFEILRANVRVPHELLGDLSRAGRRLPHRRPRAAGARAPLRRRRASRR